MLGRIGGKFVQRDAKSQGMIGRENHVLAFQHDLGRIINRIGFDLLGDEVNETDAAPFTIGQKRVCLGDRSQPAGECLHELCRVRGPVQGLPRQRLQHGQRILDPVIQFPQQQPGFLGGISRAGDIDIDANGYKRPASTRAKTDPWKLRAATGRRMRREIRRCNPGYVPLRG